MSREVGIAGRALVVLGVGLLAGCDCYLSEGPPDELDASVDASLDAAVETDAGADAGPQEVCPEGEPRLVPEDLVETHEDGCWSVTTFERPSEDVFIGAPDLALAGDGTVHIIHTRLWDGPVTLRHLTNADGVWQREILDCADVRGFQDGARLAVATSGAVYISSTPLSSFLEGPYVASNESGAWVTDRREMFRQIQGLVVSGDDDTQVHVVGSIPMPEEDRGDLLLGRRDASGEWVTEPLPPAGPWAGRDAELAVRGDGAAYVVSADACPGGPQEHDDCVNNNINPEYRVLELATNESGAWVVSRLADDVLGHTSLGLALGSNGDVHCLYAAPYELVYGVRREGEWSFEPIADLDPDSVSLAMAVDGDGAAHAIYGVHGNSEAPVLNYVTNRSGEWVSESVPVGGAGPSLAIGPDDNVHLAFSVNNLVYATRSCP